MLLNSSRIRPEERTVVGVCFGTLALFMMGHALLETARDSLFLARLPATDLPWVYLAIALATGWLVVVERRAPAQALGRALSASLFVAAVVTTVFWVASSNRSVYGLYALYVWSGLVATMVPLRLWLVVGNAFTVTQAKRLFPLVGSAGVVGALAGSLVASVAATFWRPELLVLAAAVCFLLGGAVALLLPDVKRTGERSRVAAGEAPSEERVLDNGYARRLGVIVVLASVALTLADLVFKRSVSVLVPQADLARFFSRVYLGLNLASLVLQLTGVERIVRRLGVSGALLVLPLALAASTVWLGLAGGLIATLAVKVSDGALRHSLHRTGLELLFVPMHQRLRARAKTLFDTLGQRGGQAVASVAALVAARLDPQHRALPLVVAAVAAVWGYLTVALAPHYIDLFRQTLRQTSRSPKLAAADWDIDALESVMAALNSVNDQEVRAALKLLHEEGRERVVPALLLYHPSPSVVVDASQILAKAGRKDVVPILDRLLFADTRAEVLTPLLRARGALGASETLLRRFVEHADPRVSVTALAQLVAHGLAAEDDQTRLRTLLETGSADVRLAMTDALALQPLAGAVSWIAILARDADKAVRMSALQAIVQDPQPQYLDALVGLLGERDFRADARAALVTLGEPALEHLSTALQDERRSILERRHIPRTVLRFDHPRVPAVLASRLGTETDPLVHYKLLRALDGLRARGVELSAYNDVFEREAHKAVHEIATWHAARMALQRSVPVLPVDTAELHDLLVQVLLDERQYALYRLFLALALRYPKEDMTAIARGLASDQGVLRASSRELLEAVLGPELRQAILQALDASDTRPAAPPPSPERVAEYLTLVAELSASSTRAVSNMASAVAGELTHVEAVTAATAFHAAAPSASGPVGSGAHGQ